MVKYIFMEATKYGLWIYSSLDLDIMFLETTRGLYMVEGGMFCVQMLVVILLAYYWILNISVELAFS